MIVFTYYPKAKINLTLDVLCKRKDGYHEVDMIMQTIDLCDILTVEPADDLSLCVHGDAPATEENLVLRAAHLLREYAHCDLGAHLSLTKNIPTAAGLGGGSSDAATTILALDRLWSLHIPMEKLLQWGAMLGADIPFCMMGGTARATGIGTHLVPLRSPPSMGLLLRKPCDGMLTKEVYQGLDFSQSLPRPDTTVAIQSLVDGDLYTLCNSMGNALESVTLPARPQAQTAMEQLLASGAITARMSGSGPCVFGVYETVAQAQRAKDLIGDGWVCTPVSM